MIDCPLNTNGSDLVCRLLAGIEPAFGQPTVMGEPGLTLLLAIQLQKITLDDLVRWKRLSS